MVDKCDKCFGASMNDCEECERMSLTRAERILNPETTRDALQEIDGELARIKAVKDACIIACRCIKKVIAENESFGLESYE